ncbi:MAG: hypothetical protein ACREQI_14090 [Candidatus Binataceae bacterium]
MKSLSPLLLIGLLIAFANLSFVKEAAAQATPTPIYNAETMPGGCPQIPNYTGIGAGFNFRTDINNHLCGVAATAPALVKIPFATLSQTIVTLGQQFYCTDCAAGSSPCASGGTGAFAKGDGAPPIWDCSGGGASISQNAAMPTPFPTPAPVANTCAIVQVVPPIATSDSSIAFPAGGGTDYCFAGDDCLLMSSIALSQSTGAQPSVSIAGNADLLGNGYGCTAFALGGVASSQYWQGICTATNCAGTTCPPSLLGIPTGGADSWDMSASDSAAAIDGITTGMIELQGLSGLDCKGAGASGTGAIATTGGCASTASNDEQIGVVNVIGQQLQATQIGAPSNGWAILPNGIVHTTGNTLILMAKTGSPGGAVGTTISLPAGSTWTSGMFAANCGAIAYLPTPTQTATTTATPTVTTTRSPTITETPTVTETATPTSVTPTVTTTPSPTITETPTVTATPTATGTPTATASPTMAVTATSTPSPVAMIGVGVAGPMTYVVPPTPAAASTSSVMVAFTEVSTGEFATPSGWTPINLGSPCLSFCAPYPASPSASPISFGNPNANCTGSGTCSIGTCTCCTGSGTGTCGANSYGQIAVFSNAGNNAACTANGAPWTCCTGSMTGNCGCAAMSNNNKPQGWLSGAGTTIATTPIATPTPAAGGTYSNTMASAWFWDGYATATYTGSQPSGFSVGWWTNPGPNLDGNCEYNGGCNQGGGMFYQPGDASGGAAAHITVSVSQAACSMLLVIPNEDPQ